MASRKQFRKTEPVSITECVIIGVRDVTKFYLRSRSFKPAKKENSFQFRLNQPKLEVSKKANSSMMSFD